MAPASHEDLTKSCKHEEKKCVKCGLTLTGTEGKRSKLTAAERQRRLSSGTFYGTFIKSIDESSKGENTEDDNEENREEETEEDISVSECDSSSTRCSYLVKYSVNGVFKGQTRLSYDLGDDPSLWSHRSLSTNSASSSVDRTDLQDGSNCNDEDEAPESKYTGEKEETVFEETLLQDPVQVIETRKSNSMASLPEKTRNFSIVKQHSLDEYRIPTRKASSKMQKKLSLFTSTESTTSSRNGLGSRQSSLDSETMQEGRTLTVLSEAKRKQIQQQLLEGMFKYAEQKYGRKKLQSSTVEEKRSPMEDYELYLRSLNIKVKSSSDKLAIITKQKRDIEAKLAEAEKEHNFHKSKFTKAEEEKQNAINENRDPVLPRDFIPPQKVKSRGKAANLGALVMKASSQMEIWEDKFNAKRTKKNANTPEWIAKQKKSDKTSALLNAGRNKMKEKKTEPKVPLSTLKKVEGNRTKPESKIEEQTKSKPQEPVKEEPTISSEESEESEEERSTFRRRRNRIPRSDDEDFDI